MEPRDEFIRVENMTDNETWNFCPECKKGWKDPVAIPGLIHRTVLCQSCLFEQAKKTNDGA